MDNPAADEAKPKRRHWTGTHRWEGRRRSTGSIYSIPSICLVGPMELLGAFQIAHYRSRFALFLPVGQSVPFCVHETTG